MTSSILRSIVAAGAILALGAAAHAANLDFTLKIDDPAAGGAGHYGVYASVDNSSGFVSTGLVAYKVTLNTSATGGPVSTITNFSPEITFTDSSGTNSDDIVGFTLFRSNDTITAGNPVTASEDTFHTGITLIYGMGLSGGNISTPIPPGYDGASGAVQTVYGAPVLLVEGSYTGTASLSVSNWFATKTGANDGNLFTDTNGPISSPNAVVLAVISAPEPASLGVLALGGVALLARRKKA